jgi:hypothetical protein
MRRVLSVILFVLGGWLLSSEVMMAWITPPDIDLTARVMMLGFMALIAAPLLALGTWASPGNRLAELGLTLMIVAGIGAVIALVLFVTLSDPGFSKLMPPGQKMPDLHPEPIGGVLNLLLVGGGGFLLRRWAIARVRRENPDLGQVFD